MDEIVIKSWQQRIAIDFFVALIATVLISLIIRNMVQAYEAYWSAKWNEKEVKDDRGEEWKDS